MACDVPGLQCQVNAADALRFLDHEARRCVHGSRDDREIVVLNLPALLKVLGLERMNDFEAGAFREQFRRELRR